MSKKSSKLDPHAERLTEMLLGKDEGGEGLTYAQAQEQLRLDGCEVSTQRLCDWWQQQRSERLQRRLLREIATGASQVKEVDAEFEKNPAPSIETIIKLHRLLAFQLSTMGVANPELLETATQMTKVVLDFVKEQGKKEDRQLAREKFEAMESKMKEAKKVTVSELTPEEKAARMKQIFGM